MHYVDEGLDTGDIIRQKQVPVLDTDTGATLYHKLEIAGMELLRESWDDIQSGKLSRTPQAQISGTPHKAGDTAQIDEIRLAESYRAADLLNILRARTFLRTKERSFEAEGEKCMSAFSSRPKMMEPAMANRTIDIGGRQIGPGHPAYVIAELSANHQQNFEQAVQILHAAKNAGAEAVKLQTYTADTITLRSDKDCFRIAWGTLWDGRTLYDLYQEAFTPWEWQPKLQQIANELGMHLFFSAFDDSAVDFLEQMNVPAHKVASFELVDIALIEKMARTGKPLIMSTGMASEPKFSEAVAAARSRAPLKLPS